MLHCNASEVRGPLSVVSALLCNVYEVCGTLCAGCAVTALYSHESRGLRWELLHTGAEVCAGSCFTREQKSALGAASHGRRNLHWELLHTGARVCASLSLRLPLCLCTSLTVSAPPSLSLRLPPCLCTSPVSASPCLCPSLPVSAPPLSVSAPPSLCTSSLCLCSSPLCLCASPLHGARTTRPPAGEASQGSRQATSRQHKAGRARTTRRPAKDRRARTRRPPASTLLAGLAPRDVLRRIAGLAPGDLPPAYNWRGSRLCTSPSLYLKGSTTQTPPTHTQAYEMHEIDSCTRLQ